MNPGDYHIEWMESKTGRLLDIAVDAPIRWPEPLVVCVGPDLFHGDNPYRFIDHVFAVMALCPHHEFRVATMRADRASQYVDGTYCRDGFWLGRWNPIICAATRYDPKERFAYDIQCDVLRAGGWPLRNVTVATRTDERPSGGEGEV